MLRALSILVTLVALNAGMAVGQEILRGKIDAPGGWTGILERYRETVGA